MTLSVVSLLLLLNAGVAAANPPAELSVNDVAGCYRVELGARETTIDDGPQLFSSGIELTQEPIDSAELSAFTVGEELSALTALSVFEEVRGPSSPHETRGWFARPEVTGRRFLFESAYWTIAKGQVWVVWTNGTSRASLVASDAGDVLTGTLETFWDSSGLNPPRASATIVTLHRVPCGAPRSNSALQQTGAPASK